jgi:hypothetical protein
LTSCFLSFFDRPDLFDQIIAKRAELRTVGGLEDVAASLAAVLPFSNQIVPFRSAEPFGAGAMHLIIESNAVTITWSGDMNNLMLECVEHFDSPTETIMIRTRDYHEKPARTKSPASYSPSGHGHSV